jgi:hypothetical protein
MMLAPALVCSLHCAGPEADLREARVYVPKPTGTVTQPHLGCQSGGCAYVPAPTAQDIPIEQIDQLLKEVAQTPVGADSQSLDTLLFHDGEVRERLSRADVPDIGPAWMAFLKHELDKQIATFSLRVIDEDGHQRAFLPDTAMALGAKKHLEISQTDLGTPMNANGTIVRVGLHHLWYRM